MIYRADADPDVRRRHQRGAARHHRHGRAADAARRHSLRAHHRGLVTTVTDTGSRWISHSPKTKKRCASWRARSSPTTARTSAAGGGGDAGVVRPRAVGRARARPTCSASRCRKTSAASGLGFLELCAAARGARARGGAGPALGDAGARRAADQPVRLRRRSAGSWLPGVARGETILTAALVENGCDDPRAIAATARRDGASWRLDGAKTLRARRAPRGARPRAGAHRRRRGRRVPGRSAAARRAARSATAATNGEPQFEIHARAAPRSAPTTCSAIRGRRRASSTGSLQRAIAALCAIERRRRRARAAHDRRATPPTASSSASRSRPSRPSRSAPPTPSSRSRACAGRRGRRSGASRRATPRTRTSAVAKFWAGEGGHFATYAAQHLHGGIGLDLDYPLHRYFIWSKADRADARQPDPAPRQAGRDDGERRGV